MGIKKVKNAIRDARANHDYLKYYNAPIDSNAILLEGGQGKHTDGNIFAFLRSIEASEKWGFLKPYVVVTKASMDEAGKKMRTYGFTKARLIIRNSSEYRKILATAQYLVTDNSFPPYFIKRDGQIYLNTWHGTPLKRLGRADIINATSLGNVQKNFLAADYLLEPNTFTRDIMMKDYMVDRLYGGTPVVIDYPRNDVLFTKPLEAELKRKYNPEGKRMIAYMPTWRGTGRNANIKQQIREAEEIIRNIEKELHEDELFYVNFHFLIGNQIDFSQFGKARPFPAEYETYDFLAICDTLISDYSSVMIDFAQTGKEVIMYMYDYEEYLRQKGFYFDIRTLPFKQTYSIHELVQAIHSERVKYVLDEQYRGNSFGKATETMLEMMCSQEKRTENRFGSKLVYIGDIRQEGIRFLADRYIETLSAEQKQITVLGFEGDMKDKAAIAFMKNLDDDIEFILFVGGEAIKFSEYVVLNLYKNHGFCRKKAEKYQYREYSRLFKMLGIVEAEMISTNIIERFGALAKCKCRTTVHGIPVCFYIRPADVFYAHPKTRKELFAAYDAILEYDPLFGVDFWNERECQGIYARFPVIRCVSRKESTEFTGKLIVKTEINNAALDDTIQIGSRVYDDVFEYDIHYQHLSVSSKAGITEIRCNFSFTVSNSEFNRWYTNNLLRIKLRVGESAIPVRVLVSGRRNPFKQRIFDIPDTEYICEIKEDYKHYRLVIRNRNVTDGIGQQIKLYLAFACHLLTWWNKPIVLFEKNSSRYEESAAILYEKMVDMGYRNVRFILDREYAHRDEIEAKYMKGIVNRFSFSHYYNMFAAKSIISTETLGHALEKGATNWIFKNFVIDGAKNYVFLQHGVMYMISLNSEQRDFFKKGKGKGKQRVVVSSQLEANHFTDHTGHKPEDMYICGLITFDTSTLNENNDKIVVMITWRPWEYVGGISDIKETGYYRMLHEIVECVPEELRDKLIVLPHPLIEEQVARDGDDFVWQYYMPGVKYDDILKDAKVFVSDYSSITYDAFYRGTNVVFYWKEKDSCLKEYGENSRLMLTEDLAFGEVCYNRDSLKKSIRHAYITGQSPEHIKNYGLIVEHHDSKNAERFIGMAKNDGIL